MCERAQLAAERCLVCEFLNIAQADAQQLAIAEPVQCAEEFVALLRPDDLGKLLAVKIEVGFALEVSEIAVSVPSYVATKSFPSAIASCP